MRSDGGASAGEHRKADTGGGKEKSICLCATMAKGGGNNAVTYVVELYEKVFNN